MRIGKLKGEVDELSAFLAEVELLTGPGGGGGGGGGAMAEEVGGGGDAVAAATAAPAD